MQLSAPHMREQRHFASIEPHPAAPASILPRGPPCQRSARLAEYASIGRKLVLAQLLRGSFLEGGALIDRLDQADDEHQLFGCAVSLDAETAEFRKRQFL